MKNFGLSAHSSWSRGVPGPGRWRGCLRTSQESVPVPTRVWWGRTSSLNVSCPLPDGSQWSGSPVRDPKPFVVILGVLLVYNLVQFLDSLRPLVGFPPTALYCVCFLICCSLVLQQGLFRRRQVDTSLLTEELGQSCRW